ncbi:WecB/TagA/CpsF family glycosyltransferase [Microbacterium sp. SL75]|uniref:WecB/TagA/CpsF family glycosyltransferase n=1 Tax=Microbacterium sp. SL75 TaxID=2995140 RepID=UPI00226E3A48|nr:WecB/TagA/CpsF family glycosyltransferase [Microbacterium sp. SL75]WAC68501.1 WecB/TagA/CpsF family glycosyltransferase [Microbacterium sp. SL75]
MPEWQGGSLDRSDFGLVDVGGIPFAVADPQRTVGWIVDRALSRRGGMNVRFANAWNVALASEDPAYKRLLVQPGCLNFPDGTPVVWFMRATQGAARRVRGPSVFREVLRDSSREPLRHFLLGGSPRMLEALQHRMAVEYPAARVSGVFSPPFAPLDEAYIKTCIEEVGRVESDIIWVGLGTPKQDFVGTEIAKFVSVPVLNVGAAFDFVAQTIPEAPRFVQNSGFEWLYRLLSEPRRLGRRYLYGNIRFLIVSTKHLLLRPLRSKGE